MRMSRDQLRAFAEIRFVREVQYRIGAHVDGIVGDETRRLWTAHQIDHQLAAPVTAITSRVSLIKNVQAALGLYANGVPNETTWRVWVHHAYPEVISLGVFPLPIFGGADPQMTSGFNAGRGPNFWRDSHLGGDFGFKRDMSAPPPPGWLEHHFGYRPERAFYGPPVGVRATLPGEVVYAKLLPVSAKWGGPRWAVKLDHGVLPGMGNMMSWSTHHREVLVKPGDVVEADTPIAVLGDTGARGAPHDHHEWWRWRPGTDLREEAKRTGKSVHHLAAFDLWPVVQELRRVECNELY